MSPAFHEFPGDIGAEDFLYSLTISITLYEEIRCFGLPEHAKVVTGPRRW